MAYNFSMEPQPGTYAEMKKEKIEAAFAAAGAEGVSARDLVMYSPEDIKSFGTERPEDLLKLAKDIDTVHFHDPERDVSPALHTIPVVLEILEMLQAHPDSPVSSHPGSDSSGESSPRENTRRATNLGVPYAADALHHLVRIVSESWKLDKLSPETRRQLFELIYNDSNKVRSIGLDILPMLVAADMRHTENRQNYLQIAKTDVLGLMEQAFAADRPNPAGENRENTLQKVEQYADMLAGYYPAEFMQLAVEGMLQTESAEVASHWFRILGERTSVNEALDMLMTSRKLFPEKAPIHDRILRDYLKLLPPGTTMKSIEESYEAFDIGEYDAFSEETEHEIDLIISRLGGVNGVSGKRVHDSACGTGRHLAGLARRNLGIILSGTDISPANVKAAQENVPEAEIAKASWDKLPLGDKSLDMYFNLGRSGLHNTTIGKAIQFLSEACRVTHGKVIIDRPEVVGHYKEAPARLQKALEPHGLEKRVEPGAVIDTPDNIHAFNRLNAATDEQFQAICALAGFEATILKTEDFFYGTQKNINQYWELVPRTESLTVEETITLMNKAHTLKPMMRPAFGDAAYNEEPGNNRKDIRELSGTFNNDEPTRAGENHNDIYDL